MVNRYYRINNVFKIHKKFLTSRWPFLYTFFPENSPDLFIYLFLSKPSDKNLEFCTCFKYFGNILITVKSNAATVCRSGLR